MTASPARPLPRRRLRGFLRGATYPMRGALHLFRNPRLWPYAALPFAVYAAVLVLLTTGAVLLADDAYALVRPEALATPPAGGLVASFLHDLATGIVATATVLLLAAVVVLGTLLAAAALAGPFNERLSQEVEDLARGGSAPAAALPGTLREDVTRALLSALERLVLFVLVYPPLVLLALVPVVGVAAGFGLLVYSVFFAALSFLDPALDRRRMRLRQKLRWIRGALAVSLGFGAAVFGLLLIPVAGLLLAPSFVVAGTLLTLDHDDGGASP